MNLQDIEDNCEAVSEVMKILSHPQRLRLICLLADGDKNVSELQEQCAEYDEISQSQLSQFLATMKLQGIVCSRRDGSFVSYSLSDKKILSLVKALQQIYCK